MYDAIYDDGADTLSSAHLFIFLALSLLLWYFFVTVSCSLYCVASIARSIQKWGLCLAWIHENPSSFSRFSNSVQMIFKTVDAIAASLRHNWNRAFSVAGRRAWNSLPPALRSTSKSFSSFKKEVQSFIFGLSFCL